ncbi:MAG: hypothetical protein ACR2MY_03680 [Candidatus Dormibacteria bacterium]
MTVIKRSAWRPRLAAAGAVLAVVLVAIAAFESLRPGRAVSRGATPSPQCSPHPCTELDGLKLYIQHSSTESGRLILDVTFRNDTGAQFLEAVSYRHTTPADFSLQYRGSGKVAPSTGPGCPAWPEVRIERGSAAGPERLCFLVPADASSQVLWWSPDQGAFSAAGSVPVP